MKLSILIPARNEEEGIKEVACQISDHLRNASFEHEILIVNDGSTDHTEEILIDLNKKNSSVQYVNNLAPYGYGRALQKGLEAFTGDAVTIVMSDGSDDPEDIIRYYEKIKQGSDCVFGSRFMKGSRLLGYPIHKYLLNRIANTFVKIIFKMDYNDITNGFKCYHRRVIEGVGPLSACDFELNVELPIKAVLRGFRYEVIPVSWTSRKKGLSKLAIHRMAGKYLSMIIRLSKEKK